MVISFPITPFFLIRIKIIIIIRLWWGVIIERDFFEARLFGCYVAGIVSPTVILLGKLYYALDISQFALVTLIFLMILNVLTSDRLINILFNIHKGFMSVNDLLDNYLQFIVFSYSREGIYKIYDNLFLNDDVEGVVFYRI